MNKTKINFLTCGIAGVVLIIALAITFLLKPTQPISVIHPIYAANFADDTILMGSSHNVFIGRVIARVGNKDLAESPATQFSVEVIKNIKGELSNTITVEQQGGEKDGVMYVFEDSLSMLQLGSTYLFATRYNATEGWYTLNSHPNASKLLSSDSSLDTVALKSIADKDSKVKTLEEAFPNEKLLDADVYHANTRNAFKSLPAEAKASAQSRADEARVSLGKSSPAQ